MSGDNPQPWPFRPRLGTIPGRGATGRGFDETPGLSRSPGIGGRGRAGHVWGQSPDGARGAMAAMRHEGFHGRAGFGQRPALLVIDVNVGFTDPASPLVCELDAVVDAIRRLLGEARCA